MTLAAAAVESGTQARDYAAQFIKDDPERCFQPPAVTQPQLEARAPQRAESGGAVPRRVVVLVDGSGSMAAKIGQRTKLELAREAAQAFVDGLPPTVEVSLLAFGQQGNNTEAGKARSCTGIDTLLSASTDRAGFRAALGQLKAVGWTPLAAALKQGQQILEASDRAGEQVIYVVSDGQETCGGDPVSVARSINTGRTRAIVHVIGFGLPPADTAALQSVAKAGGGRFINAQTEADVDRALEAVREANRRAANAVRASNAISGNAARSADAGSKASLCISNIIQGESKRLSDDLAARAAQGKSPPFAGEALRWMKQRHDELHARDKQFRERLEKDDRKTRSSIEAEGRTR